MNTKLKRPSKGEVTRANTPHGRPNTEPKIKVADAVTIRHIPVPCPPNGLLGRKGIVLEADEANDSYLIKLHATATHDAEEVYCDRENLTGRRQ